MPGGRPTKYNPEIVEKAEHYLNNFSEYEYNEIPSQTGLSRALDIALATVKAWGKDENKQEFSAILEKIHKKQHDILISKGLNGDFNSNICKLVLGKHGYHDKQELKDTTSRKLTNDQLQAQIDTLEERINDQEK